MGQGLKVLDEHFAAAGNQGQAVLEMRTSHTGGVTEIRQRDGVVLT
jgi:hypothetical protein